MSSDLAFLFPGQGTVPEALPETPFGAELVSHAERRGVPLLGLLREADPKALRATEIAQPLIYIDSVAKARALRKAGWEPTAVAGHSLGEYAALAVGGVFPVEAGLDLVIERGRAMAAVPGAMAAILKLTLADVEAICLRIGDGVNIANINGERQIVVSGEDAAVMAVVEEAAAEGGRGIPLAVSGPFHSPLMEDASARFAQTLAGVAFRDPSVRFVSAVSGAEEHSGEALHALMERQMLACVRWLDVMQQIEAMAVSRAVEAGPGRVLIGLGSRILPDLPILSYEEAIGSDG
jgi:[acyl-carrier-protein] S-malonyltransferase